MTVPFNKGKTGVNSLLSQPLVMRVERDQCQGSLFMLQGK